MPAFAFSQNVLMVGGDVNPFKPSHWSAGIGFNLGIVGDYIQNDTFLNFGGFSEALFKDTLRAQHTPRWDFLVSVKDNVYFSYELPFIGFRVGVSAGFGAYSADFGDCLFTIGGLAGVVILPKSPVSVVIDVNPSFGVAFNLSNNHPYFAQFITNGFSMPISLALRINLDFF
jgi:hypothetical protein